MKRKDKAKHGDKERAAKREEEIARAVAETNARRAELEALWARTRKVPK